MRSKIVRAGAALFVAVAAFVPAHLASASASKKPVPGFQCPADQATFDYMKAYIQQLIDAGIALPPELADIDDAALCALITDNSGGGEETTTTTSDDDHEKIEICHATGNPNHPYVELTVDANGLNGHGDDPDDLIPAPEGGCPETTTSTTRETTSTTEDETTSTTAEETTSTTAEETTSTTAEETTSTTAEETTSTTAEETTTTTAEETTTTTAQETTTTTAPTTTTTAKATTTSTTAATTSTTAATTSTTAAATTSTTGATTTTAAHSTTDPTVAGVVVTFGGTLPRTGSDAAPLVALGCLTAGLGFVLLLVRRRFVS